MPARALSPKHFVPIPRTGSRTLSSKPRRATAVITFPSGELQSSKARATELFQKFAKRSELPLGTLRAQLIPDSSWKRCAEILGPAASQTVARLSRALTFAVRTWGDENDAIDWLLGQHMELDGATPFALLRTETGGRVVENLMAALEYGFGL